MINENNNQSFNNDLTNVTNKTIFINELLTLDIIGINNLISFLFRNNFFRSPASTKYHGNYCGGLCDHSINVLSQLRKFNLSVPKRTLVLTALLHDICKTKLYLKNESGYYLNDEEKNKGHAKYSLDIIEQFIELNELEKNMIRFHMGWYGTISWMRPEYSITELLKAMNIKEVKALHLADEYASLFIDKNE